ncbi:MAG: TROVE domain-containing protein [Cytophagales bacterium]|nr:TROVE domain-containing protein [Cytophagales bacterium]
MRFNVSNKQKEKTYNYEGAVAYSKSETLELYSAVVTSSLSGDLYENAWDRLNRIIYLIDKVDPVFAAKLAIYAREEMHLRSIPLVLVAELSRIHRGDELVKKATARVIQRADEITELLAYYQLANSRSGEKKLNKLSKQLQKGIASAFNKFDEYQFAKYNRKTEVTLRDALFLTHPKAASDEQQLLFNKIVNDELEVPYTWEVELSQVGQRPFTNPKNKASAMTAKWEELIDSGKLGYMATLRNLRNFLEAGVQRSSIKKVAKLLGDPKQVKRSKQLPFRFLSAYRELEKLKLNHATYLMNSLEKAVMASAANIKGFGLDQRVLLAADVSGSMYSPVSYNSKVRCFDIGLVLSMLLASRSVNVVTGIFGSTWSEKNLSKKDILSNVRKLERLAGSVGYSTNGHRVIDALIATKREMDKVMFFTDLQMWDSTYGGESLRASWTKYKRYVAPKAKLYLFDLMGHGNTPLSLKGNDVYLIAGWSDKIFEVLDAIENGASAISCINQIEI